MSKMTRFEYRYIARTLLLIVTITATMQNRGMGQNGGFPGFSPPNNSDFQPQSQFNSQTVEPGNGSQFLQPQDSIYNRLITQDRSGQSQEVAPAADDPNSQRNNPSLTPIPGNSEPRIQSPATIMQPQFGEFPQVFDPTISNTPNPVINETPGVGMSWFDWRQWENSFELGINGGSGNSESFNVTSGFDMSQKTELAEMKIGFKYINNKSNAAVVAHNARLNLDWDRNFGGESLWSWFIKNNYYYDDFRPFDLRFALNSGLGYRFIDTEIQTFKGRFGVGVSREFGGVNEDWIPEALFGIDYRRQLTRKQKLLLTVDYFPSWEDYNDYRLVTDASWEFLVDEEANLSLKLNVNDQYDSTPDGARANDIFYSMLMLWKF